MDESVTLTYGGRGDGGESEVRRCGVCVSVRRHSHSGYDVTSPSPSWTNRQPERAASVAQCGCSGV